MSYSFVLSSINSVFFDTSSIFAFESEIKLCRKDSNAEADCRSVLAMLMLAAGKDTELELVAKGADAVEAAAAVEAYFQRNFDEA